MLCIPAFAEMTRKWLNASRALRVLRQCELGDQRLVLGVRQLVHRSLCEAQRNLCAVHRYERHLSVAHQNHGAAHPCGVQRSRGAVQLQSRAVRC